MLPNSFAGKSKAFVDRGAGSSIVLYRRAFDGGSLRLSSGHRTAALLIQQGLHISTKMPEIFRQIPGSILSPYRLIFSDWLQTNGSFLPKNTSFQKILHNFRIQCPVRLAHP